MNWDSGKIVLAVSAVVTVVVWYSPMSFEAAILFWLILINANLSKLN